MNLLNLILRGLMGCLKVHKEGIWEYVKLPNGLAICWGTKVNEEETMHQEDVVSYTLVYADLPTGLFVETPKIFTNLSSRWIGWTAVAEGGTSKEKVGIYESTLRATEHKGHKIHALVIGRWK